MKWLSLLFAVVILFSLIFYNMTLSQLRYSLSDSDTEHPFPVEPAIHTYSTQHLLEPLKTQNHKKFNQKKCSTIPLTNDKLSIFKGRGATKNLAIFNILVTSGPQSISDIQRKLNKLRGLEVSYYASLNKRMHALQQGGYVGETQQTALSKNHLRAVHYEVYAKFYLAMYLNRRSKDDILRKIDNHNALIVLTDLINAEVNAESTIR